MNSLTPAIEQTADGALVVVSTTVAAETENQHASVLRLVRDSLADFEEFGGVGFEIRPFETPGGQQQREVALLNEQQATLLTTYMRNNEKVREFKKGLVKAFFDMAQRLHNPLAAPELISRADLARMVLAAEEEKAALAERLKKQEPVIAYHERFVAESDDIVTIDNFASQFGSTGPAVRELLKAKGVAVRRTIGKRWSNTKHRMEDEHEWRPRQGVRTSDWFELRPQHNAPRLHNGQVRQTLYVRQFYATDLALKLGLAVQERLEVRA